MLGIFRIANEPGAATGALAAQYKVWGFRLRPDRSRFALRPHKPGSRVKTFIRQFNGDIIFVLD
jgi:hypothetical protein